MAGIFSLIFFISFFEMFPILGIGCDLSIFNPIRNYNKWNKINWFGVIVATVLLNIGFPLYALVYWVYKLVTVGRKQNTFISNEVKYDN